MSNTPPADWFLSALTDINSDLNGTLGELSEAQVEVARIAMVATLRTTITAHPAGFKDMLERLAPHSQRVTDAPARAAAT